MKYVPQAIRTRGVLILWILAVVTVIVWARLGGVGWDVDIYHAGIRSLRAGHDPYTDATSVQRLFHQQLLADPKLLAQDPPFSYVYSPITLPLLRLIGVFPGWLSGTIYYLLYFAAALAQVWVTFRAVERSERPYFRYFAPVAIFFPGFLANATIMSGNIAYILYAVILLAAVFGWRRGIWRWFYLAVLAASCVKAPLLSLVVIPLLSARRQWFPVAAVGAAGLALFAVQPVLWPTLFRHYLEAVDLQFRFNRDFGCSPAGLFGDILYSRGISYSPGSMIFFVAYAIPLFTLLVYLSRLYLRGSFSLAQWMPVMLVGVILLNPRIMEYDTAPIALPLALLAWRFLARWTTPTHRIVWLSLFFVAANLVGTLSWSIRKLTDGPLLVLFFGAGAWDLHRLARATGPQPLAAGQAHEQPTAMLFK